MKTKPAYEFDLSSVKGLVYKKAIQSWRMLPPKTRAYIDIEDMFQDGIFYVSRFMASGKHKYKYDPRKGKVTTVLWNNLDNFYRRSAEVLNTHKRFDGNVLLIEDLKANGIDIEADQEEAEICEHIRNVFLETYGDASDRLRESMRRWFLQMEHTKIHTKSIRFLQDKIEFKKLAELNGLDVKDCRILIHSSKIRNDIISRLPEYQYIEI